MIVIALAPSSYFSIYPVAPSAMGSMFCARSSTTQVFPRATCSRYNFAPHPRPSFQMQTNPNEYKSLTHPQFTRSSPWGHWFQKFLQPHDDNYHLLHHLLPKIPMSKLHEADGWLIAHSTQYAEANREQISPLYLWLVSWD